MRLALIGMLATMGAAQAAPCGNTAFNISRTSECLSYTTDRQQQNDLKDKRLDAMNEWLALNPLGGSALDTMLKEGDRRMSSALARDYAVFSDKSMWELRGCASLPVCVADMQRSVNNPRVRAKPVPPPARVNTRTGGAWCGPKDRAHGYCNWKGWLR